MHCMAPEAGWSSYEVKTPSYALEACMIQQYSLLWILCFEFLSCVQRFYFPPISILTKSPQNRQRPNVTLFAEEESQEGEVAEELEEEKEEEEEEEDDEDEQDIMKVLGKLVMAMFIKYWIYVCGGMFFFVSFEGRIVMYKIIYMVLFLFCVALYQVSESCVD